MGCSGLTGGRRAGPGGILLGLDRLRIVAGENQTAPTSRRASTLESPCSSIRFRYRPDRCPTPTLVDLPHAEPSPSPSPDPFQRAVRKTASRASTLCRLPGAERQIQ